MAEDTLLCIGVVQSKTHPLCTAVVDNEFFFQLSVRRISHHITHLLLLMFTIFVDSNLLSEAMVLQASYRCDQAPGSICFRLFLFCFYTLNKQAVCFIIMNKTSSEKQTPLGAYLNSIELIMCTYCTAALLDG